MTQQGRVARGDATEPSFTDTPRAVDVIVGEPAPLRRTLAIAWNPLALFIDRVSADVVVVPGDHHGLVLSPFYTWASTVGYATNVDGAGNALPYSLNVLAQTFHGFGCELGYRYYLEKGGPRGLFFGPSLLAAAMKATAGNGSQTGYAELGIAVDVGYEALVMDAVAIGLGAGVQYAFPTESIPPQQLPASIYANAGVQPRLLLSLGYAF